MLTGLGLTGPVLTGLALSGPVLAGLAGNAVRGEHPVQGRGHLFGQPRSGAARVAGGLAGGSGLADLAAVLAFHLAEPANQPYAAAGGAVVQVAGPVVSGLAGRADEHLAVLTDAALPGTGAPVRIDLAGTAAVTGHRGRAGG